MPNYKLMIAYDGTRYNGWQKQGNTEKTIQGKLEAVLERFVRVTRLLYKELYISKDNVAYNVGKFLV